MPLPPWPEMLLFMALVLMACIFGVVVTGHFPAEHRSPALRTMAGAALLWTTILLHLAVAGIALYVAWLAIPWYAAVIGGGLMALLAPFLVQPFPDSIVNAPASLLVLSLAAGAFAGAAVHLSV